MDRIASRGAAVDAPLEGTFTHALRLEGEGRRNKVAELNAALRAASVEQAPVISKLLDDPQFLELHDPFGIRCRAEAVSALLRFGFPWALHITPEDLEVARRDTPRRWDDGNRIGAGLVLTVASGAVLIGVMALLSSADGHSRDALALAVGGLVVAAYGGRGLLAPFARARREALLRTSGWGVAAVVLLVTLISLCSGSLLLILGALLAGLLAGATFLSSFAMPEIEREPGFE